MVGLPVVDFVLGVVDSVVELEVVDCVEAVEEDDVILLELDIGCKEDDDVDIDVGE